MFGCDSLDVEYRIRAVAFVHRKSKCVVWNYSIAGNPLGLGVRMPPEVNTKGVLNGNRTIKHPVYPVFGVNVEMSVQGLCRMSHEHVVGRMRGHLHGQWARPIPAGEDTNWTGTFLVLPVGVC